MVHSVKCSLKKCIGRALLTHDELNTMLVEVEFVINSRALTYVFNDSECINYSLFDIWPTQNVGHFETISTCESLSR